MDKKKIINITLGTIISSITGYTFTKINKIKNENEKINLLIRNIELIGVLSWPIIFDTIVGYDKIVNNKLLLIPFSIPILRGLDGYKKFLFNAKKKNKKEYKEFIDEYLKNDNDQTKLSSVTNQIVTFAYFINMIATKCDKKNENIFNPILITYVIGSLTEFISNLSIFSNVKNIYINLVKKIISIYCTCIILAIAIDNLYIKNEKK